MIPNIILYTDRLPEGVGGEARGPVIRIRPRYRGDAGILAHEREHVRQWSVGVLVGAIAALIMPLASPGFAFWWPVAFSLGACIHPLAYLASPRYRLWAEVRAYRIQARYYPDDRRALFASFLATRYKLFMSESNALAAIKGKD